MDDYKISEAIYAESLITPSFRISDDIYEESVNLSEEKLRQELSASFTFSGRYWVWKLGSAVYEYKWKRMLASDEMQMPAKGFKYFLTYPDITSLQMEYFNKNGSKGMSGTYKVGKGLDQTKPAAYYDFSRSLRIWDVVLVVGAKSRVVAWGQVKSDYFYRPTRAYGRHFRRVSWNRIDMPFELTDKHEYLYLLPYGDVTALREKLIGQLCLEKNSLPFGFVGDAMEFSIPFELEACTLMQKKQLPLEQKLVLGRIIGALLRIVQ